MELYNYFRSFIETEEEPVVICDLDYNIIYINSASAAANANIGGYDIVGKSLNLYMDFETQSKINMVVEWFKESKDNNRVFAIKFNATSTDTYISALRDEKGDLIGFCNKRRCRIPDKTEPYGEI
jgi:homoserine kinase